MPPKSYNQLKNVMIEKITLRLNSESRLVPDDDTPCDDRSAKTLLLYAGAKCAGLTALYIMNKERVSPKRFEISLSGELSPETTHAESLFTSFHMVYNIECATQNDQIKVSRAVTIAHDKLCSMLQMLRRIAPISHEIAIVSTEPVKV